jgi:hypothetical protein
MKKLLQQLALLAKQAKLSQLETFIIIALFAFFPLGQITRISLSPGLAIYFHDILIVLWLIFNHKHIFTTQLTTQIQKISAKTVAIPLVTGWIALGMVVAMLRFQDVTTFLFLGRVVLYLLFAWTFWVRFAQESFIRLSLMITGSMYAGFAILQYIFLPDTRFLTAFGWDEHYYRMVGTLLDPAFTGMLLIFTLITVYSLQKQLSNWWKLVLLLILTAGVVLTYSRASYIALIVSLVLLAITEMFKKFPTRKQVLIATAVIVLVCLTYYSAPKPGGDGVNLLRTTSISARLSSASQALTTLSGYEWVLGRGLFSKSATAVPSELQIIQTHARMPDNIFVTLLTQTGIVGLLLGSYLMVRCISYFWKVDRYVAIALVAVLLHSQFNNSLLQPFVLLYLLLFIASSRIRNLI